MEPIDAQEHYTERLICLPNLMIYYEPLNIRPKPLSRSELSLRPTSIAYWCGQALFKYLPQYDSVFPRIAKNVGDYQFVFLNFMFSNYATELFQQRLERAFAAFDLRAADYCLFRSIRGAEPYAAAAARCDVGLDTIGWSGCNSTLECLAQDLPIVTCAGALMRGRHTLAILKMMDVTETIAATVDEYVSIAARMARDTEWRSTVQEKISRNKYMLYRDRTAITALEEFLAASARGLWRA